MARKIKELFKRLWNLGLKEFTIGLLFFNPRILKNATKLCLTMWGLSPLPIVPHFRHFVNAFMSNIINFLTTYHILAVIGVILVVIGCVKLIHAFIVKRGK